MIRDSFRQSIRFHFLRNLKRRILMISLRSCRKSKKWTTWTPEFHFIPLLHEYILSPCKGPWMARIMTRGMNYPSYPQHNMWNKQLWGMSFTFLWKTLGHICAYVHNFNGLYTYWITEYNKFLLNEKDNCSQNKILALKLDLLDNLDGFFHCFYTFSFYEKLSNSISRDSKLSPYYPQNY